MKMKYTLSMIMPVIILSGCAQLQADLDALSKPSNSFSNSMRSSSSAATGTPISNPWNITDEQAMNYLTQDYYAGTLPNVTAKNWSVFWAMQYHSKTPLVAEAEKYCYVPSYSSRVVGKNCSLLWQAQMNNASDEMIQSTQQN